MNKVSWQRILQRAGHEFPNEGEGSSVVQMREGPPARENPRAARNDYGAPPHNAGPAPGLLETELKRALDRASRRENPVQAAGTPPGWEPIFMAQEVMSGKKAPPPAPMPNAEATGIKRASSGARNILAISLSAAVVGLAFQQISAQWNESRGGNSVRAVPEATSSASVLYAGGSTDDSQSGYGVQAPADEPPAPQRRASLTEDAPQPVAGAARDRDAFMREIDEAASVLAASPKPAERSRQPVTPVSAPLKENTASPVDPKIISGTEEQSMLRRARELMERGHMSGARLIFEHLAIRQSALGAFALAQTYDEKFLKTFPVQGMQAEPALAAKWYRRAAELGSQFAGKN